MVGYGRTSCVRIPPDFVDEMPFEDGDLLGAIEMPTLLGYGEPPLGLS